MDASILIGLLAVIVWVTYLWMKTMTALKSWVLRGLEAYTDRTAAIREGFFQ